MPKPKPARRKRHSGGIHWGRWIVLLALVGAAGWFYEMHRPVWDQWRAVALHPRARGGAAPPAAAAPAIAAMDNCGSQRMAVQMLADADAKLVQPQHPQSASLRQLVALPRPVPVFSLNARRAPVERNVYQVEALLLRYRLDADQNYRLVLGSETDPSLAVSALIPSGRCSTNADEAPLWNELKEDLNLRFGPAGAGFTELPHPPRVVVTGVAYFGAQGFELAPLLDIRIQ